MPTQERYAREASKKFRHLAKSLSAMKGDPSEIKKALKEHPRVLKFLDDQIGTQEGNDSVRHTRNATIRLLLKYITKELGLREAIEKSEKLYLKHYVNKRVQRAQRSLKEVIPKEIRNFLPPKITIDVDKDGFIKRISDIFDNESYNLERKIEAQKQILKDLGEIKKKIYKDLSSNDEWERCAALATAIIMETGIRPGNKKNRAVEGGREVKTFGAVSLKGNHVSFKGDHVVLSFKGKKGTQNQALVKDEVLISELKKLKQKSAGSYLFGSLDYDDLSKYFTEKFGDLNITDFRKLRATREVFDALKAEQKALYKKIRGYAQDEVEIAHQKILNDITEMLERAHEKAQVALSHESSTTTKNSYINPQVILSFLSRGEMLDSLESCVLEGKTKLDFDLDSFLIKAQKKASLGCLQSVLARVQRLL